MNDNSLPKPAQTPTSSSSSNSLNPSVVGASTPQPSPLSSGQPPMPGFIPSTAPLTPQSPSTPQTNVPRTLPTQPMGTPFSSSIPSSPQSSTNVAPMGVNQSFSGGFRTPTPVPAPSVSSAPTGGVQPLKSSFTSPAQMKPSQGAPSQTSEKASPPPVSTVSTTAPKMAAPKKSVLRFLPFLLIGVGVLAVIGFIAFWLLSRQSTTDENNTTQVPVQTKQVTLQYWGLWEPTTVMQEVITDFETQNPGVKISYTQQSPTEYRERVQTAIATGSGPDIFRFHASWTPMLRTELATLPEKIMTSGEFEQTFYPVASQQLTLNGQKVGIPLMYDGLGLYYNKQIFSIANENPPQSWEDVKRLATELTIKEGGKITRAGIALGTSSNVEHYSDIIGLMMLQNGADPLQPNSPKGQEALSFYNSFAKTLEVWDDTLPSSTTAFSRGDVVMMLAPSWRVHEIKAKNPNLEFGIVPVPQLADTERTAWASYWAEGVSSQSSNKEAAWIFLKYLSSSQVQKKLYSDAKKVRAFGEMYSRVDLSGEIANDEYVGAYMQDAPFAKSSYLNAYTHDNGINDRINKYYFDAVTAMTQGTSVADVVTTVNQGVSQVLQQYGFQSQQPTAP